MKENKSSEVWNKNRILSVSEFYKINHYVFEPRTLSNNNSATRGARRAAPDLSLLAATSIFFSRTLNNLEDRYVSLIIPF